MRKLFQGKNLIYIIGALVLIVVAAVFVKVPLPTISLPAEHIPGWYIFGFPITNTFLATILADITVLVIGFLAVRKMKDVPEGFFQNMMEWVVEIFDGMLTDIGGKKKARAWLPMFLTLLLFLRSHPREGEELGHCHATIAHRHLTESEGTRSTRKIRLHRGP